MQQVWVGAENLHFPQAPRHAAGAGTHLGGLEEAGGAGRRGRRRRWCTTHYVSFLIPQPWEREGFVSPRPGAGGERGAALALLKAEERRAPGAGHCTRTVSVALLGLGTLRRPEASGHLGGWLGVERSGVRVLRKLVVVKTIMIISDIDMIMTMMMTIVIVMATLAGLRAQLILLSYRHAAEAPA